MIPIKNEDEIELMRISSKITSEAFIHVWSLIKPGVSTGKLDEEIEKFIRSKKPDRLLRDCMVFRPIPAYLLTMKWCMEFRIIAGY